MRWSGIAAADVDVRRGDVDPELHAQRPAERELALELALRAARRRRSGSARRSHGPSLAQFRAFCSAERRSPPRATARAVAGSASSASSPCWCWWACSASPPSPTGSSSGSAATSPSSTPRAATASSATARSTTRAASACSPSCAGRESRDRRRLERDRAGDEAGDRRDRGPPLLRAPRRRRPRHPPRGLAGRPQQEGRPGRLDDHAAVRQEHVRAARADRSAAS